MPRRPRRNHTPAFKAQVALAAIKGDLARRPGHRRNAGGQQDIVDRFVDWSHMSWKICLYTNILVLLCQNSGRLILS
jgi:hypothetical protein